MSSPPTYGTTTSDTVTARGAAVPHQTPASLNLADRAVLLSTRVAVIALFLAATSGAIIQRLTTGPSHHRTPPAASR